MARKDDEYLSLEEDAPEGRRPVASRTRAPQAPDDFDELSERAGHPEDLEFEEESPFLRGQRRVPPRRGPLPRKAANRVKLAAISLAVLVACGGVAAVLYNYGTGSWRFRIDSSDNLEIEGVQNVTRAQVMEVFGGDIGRNIFYVPLAERKKQLEEIPWVESATVMRLLPNRIKVQVVERTPVAFVSIGSKVSLIDASGVIMELPPKAGKKYSFPVIVAMEESEPLSTRAVRMKTYMRLVRDLDSGGAHYSQALSEVDLSDPEDVKATVTDPDGTVLIHLGDDQFLQRYKIYLAYVGQWRSQFAKLNSVDLRYYPQVIVNPDTSANAAHQAPHAPVANAATKNAAHHSPVLRKRH
jgi:cell division protein FtsQ